MTYIEKLSFLHYELFYSKMSCKIDKHLIFLLWTEQQSFKLMIVYFPWQCKDLN